MVKAAPSKFQVSDVHLVGCKRISGNKFLVAINSKNMGSNGANAKWSKCFNLKGRL